MPLTQVNPNIPLGFEDFARIYTSNPVMSPDQVADDLYLHAPSSGTDYMRKQWDRFGTGTSPEKFFSKPEIAAALMAGGPLPAQALPVVARRGRGTASAAPAPSAPSVQPGQVVDPSVQGPSPLARAWPNFRNDAERQIAIDSGTFSPEFVNPLAKTAYDVSVAAKERDQAQRQAYEAHMSPVAPDYLKIPGLEGVSGILQNREAVVRGQLAGDQSGFAAKFLRKQMGLDPKDISNPITQPYLPPTGFGKIEQQDPTKDMLDRHIYDDPDFKELMVKNPHQAAFVYQRLTGRALGGALTDPKTGEPVNTGDIGAAIAFHNERAKVAQSMQDKQREAMGMIPIDVAKSEALKTNDDEHRLLNLPMETANNFAAAQYKAGATYDPVKKTFNLLTLGPAPEGGIGLQTPKSVRDFHQATEEEDRMMRMGHPNVTGRPLPTVREFSPAEFAATAAIQKNPAISEIQPLISAAEKHLGHSLNPDEVRRIKSIGEQKYYSQKLEAMKHGAWNSYLQKQNALLFGIKGTDEQGLALDPLSLEQGDPNMDNNLNWWGKYLYHGSGQVPTPVPQATGSYPDPRLPGSIMRGGG